MPSIKDQPKPKSNSRPAVWDLVINDMQERDALGRHRYGTPLQPFNGRDALVDAYQEALDLAVYLRQAIEERNTVQPPVIEQVPERKTCDRCGKPVGLNDWDIHTCTPPESKRPQPARREKEVQHKETGELSWLDEHEYVGYWIKTTGRMRDLYAELPKQKCWLCGDMDPAFQARCKVPACGMKEQPAPVQPVAWRWKNNGGDKWLNEYVYLDRGGPDCPEECEPLYNTPPAAQPATEDSSVVQPAAQPPVALTKEQIKDLCKSAGYGMTSMQARADFINGIRHAEAAHGIKNQP